jgi:hypothetical protein
MAASPKFKVYDAQGEYQAACKRPEEAACLVTFLGDGATVRLEHRRVVWTEGSEAQPAAESYDKAAAIMLQRAGHYGRL